MTHVQRTLAALGIALVVIISGCDNTTAMTDTESEESAAQLTLAQTYDQVRAGARLIIAYDAPSNSFIGTVENTTSNTLPQVRVEIHLSNGTELGPTTPGDLAPAEKRTITLAATSQPFTTWSAHPEVGAQGSEGGGEGSEGGGESGEGSHGNEGGGG